MFVKLLYIWSFANETGGNDNIIKDKNQKVNLFKYKTKIIGRKSNNKRLNAVVAPLKYSSNFWRSLDLPLINCEKELDLTCIEKCVTSQVSRTFREVDPNVDPDEYEVETATLCSSYCFTYKW